MPEKDINDLDNFASVLEKIKFTADEYLHGELPELPEEIADCKEYLDYIEEEKKYLEEIKLAEYIPETSVSQFVMDKIIENKIVISKPQRRRFVPVGLISAAAVIIVMFAVSRGGAFDLFMKSTQENNSSANQAADNNIYDEKAEEGYMYGDGYYEEDEEAPEEFGAEPEIALAVPAAFDININENINEAADMDMGMGEAAAEVAAAAPALRTAPEAVDESRFSSEMDEHIPKISGVQISEIYRFYYIGALNMPDEKRASITKDIEIYKTDEEFNVFDIFDKEYQETLENNLLENNIVIGEILNKEHDGKYIAVIYWSN